MDTGIMLQDFLFVISGTAMGFFSGLVPGVGNLVSLFLIYPFLLDATLLQMLLFYMALISVSQFSGSVVATVFGVPGESSSLPAVREGKKLFTRGQGNFAISNAAMGSVLGSFIAVSLVLIVLPHAVELIKNFYNTTIQVAILAFSTLSVIFLMGDNKIQNLFVFVLGFMLGMIGHHDLPFFVFAPEILPYDTFPKLLLGLPLFPVIVSLYVFPVLLQTAEQFKNYQTDKEYKDDAPIRLHFREFFNNMWASIRGSSLGCFIGLIPHVGTIVSSNLSYSLEKRIGQKKGTYRDDGDMKSLVSAESANNSTAMISLMPLLLLGIPISGSEAMLLSMIEMNSYIINYTTTIETDLFMNLVYWFVFINIVAIILCWPAVKYVNVLQKVNMNILFWLTGLVLVVLVLYTGYIGMNTFYYFMVMVCLLPLGYALRKTEPLVLLIAFILQDKLLSSVITFYHIHLG